MFKDAFISVCWNTPKCSLLSPLYIPMYSTPALEFLGLAHPQGGQASARPSGQEETHPALHCSDLSQENAPFWNPATTNWGQGVLFWTWSLPKKTYTARWSLLGNNQKKAGTEKTPHDLALSCWHYFGIALLKDRAAHSISKRKRPACRYLYDVPTPQTPIPMSVNTVSMFEWAAQGGCWSLWSAVCSAAPHTCISRCEPCPERCSATFQLALRHPALCAMLPALKCFAGRFQTLFPFFYLVIKVSRRICSQPCTFKHQQQALQQFVFWEYVFIHFSSWLSLIYPGLP